MVGSYDTFISKRGGTINVTAGSLTIDGHGNSSTGISTENGLTDTDNADEVGTINITTTENTNILNGGSISSANGFSGNAGSINISVGGHLLLSDGMITTEAHFGNGGKITINAPAVILNNGQVTTSSVVGYDGDSNGRRGGDITISGGYLVLDTGFIQANVDGNNAQGGNIFINMDGLLPNGGIVNVGGQTSETFTINSGRNVIQAAAPGGESGTITFSNPNDDTASSIGATSNRLEPLQFAKNSCGAFKQGRARLRNKGDKGLPNSGADVMKISPRVKNEDSENDAKNSEDTYTPRPQHRQAICADG